MEWPAPTAPGRSLEVGGNAGSRWMVAHPAPRRGTEPGLQANCKKGPPGPFLRSAVLRCRAQADLPSIRVIFVPHFGHVPWAAALVGLLLVGLGVAIVAGRPVMPKSAAPWMLR